MEKITKTSTKDIIFDAYQEALKKVKELQTIQLNPVKEIQEKKTAVVLQKAEVVTSSDITSKVKEVNDAVTKALGDLLGTIQQETENYDTVVEAIAIKNKELKDLFGIEADASSMAALINSKADIMEKLDDAIAEKRSENQKAGAELDAEFSLRKNTLEADLRKTNVDILALRSKEATEYKYNFDRQKMLDKDAWTDEMKATKKNFEDGLAVQEAISDKRSDTLKVREAAVFEREANIAVLEEKVAGIPALIDAAVAKAVAEKEKSLNTGFAIEKNYIKKDMESQAALAQVKIDSLTNEVTKNVASINDLASKLDTAYGKIETLARASVDGASGTKYIANLEQMFKDGNNNRASVK